ncbi:MAG: DNA photolyase family protein [Actinomycetota bacterium]|nr:DNA photolyase family protein [Actinomycetota bacterium]
MWFRRDLRLSDHPAVNQAAADADEVVSLFVFDPRLIAAAGTPRRAYLQRSLRSLDDDLEDTLVLRHGDPVECVADVARTAGATSVHVSADFGPYGAQRDVAVEQALAEHGIALVRTGSPYAVAPGRVTKPDGSPYRVYSPYYRSWTTHGWRPPAEDAQVTWVRPVDSDGYPQPPDVDVDVALPVAGESAALQRWAEFRSNQIDGYRDERNRPDLDSTSRLSVHLKFGELHPRTLLAELGDAPAHETFRKELAWREFYADVLHHQPESARDYLRPEFASMRYDRGPVAEERLRAWQLGRTGYPIVDAGMRQLLAEGWMHNRVRMIVASFLVKDLHLEWQQGARWFMRCLVDGDLASNAHGWQWTAGCGTDAAPYFRVFNPLRQGEKFDPSGDYVRRYVPELRHLPGTQVHQPWSAPGGLDGGYPAPIVDHATERAESLARYAAL